MEMSAHQISFLCPLIQERLVAVFADATTPLIYICRAENSYTILLASASAAAFISVPDYAQFI